MKVTRPFRRCALPGRRGLKPRGCPRPAAPAAFTRLELAAVIAILGVLSLAVVPATTSPAARGRSLQCLNNLRQLINAWQMYSTDNHGKLVMNFHGSMAAVPAKLGTGDAPWAMGWMDWSISADNTNVLYLIDDRYGKLAKYFKQDANVFKCPADRALSPAQRAMGWTRRVRSYSGNIGIGDGNAEAGPWGEICRHIREASDFLYPGPAETWVYLEEHPDSINDPGFFNPEKPTGWNDVPAVTHGAACGFAFADGHTELHKWAGSLLAKRARTVQAEDGDPISGWLSAPEGDPDIHWMSYHAGRKTAYSY